ncbi:MAG: hypothetical protein JXX14_19075 [Deltaproteobacteria bacterium]|nr:hypothetical protein [Deltaproteobacteria bacterium]
MGNMACEINDSQQRLQIYEKIEKSLSHAADGLCMIEQLVDIKAELGNVQQILLTVETDARAVENYRLSSLARAVFLLLGQVIDTHRVQPDTYAYLIYAVKIIVRLAAVSRYAIITGFETLDNTYGEAISAIIDHTSELMAPHMQG